MDNILEGNKLIMFFDGAENTTVDIMGKLADAIKYKESYYPPDNLPKFNEDWNLLMPIVEKITKLGFRVKTNFNPIDNSVIIQEVENHENTLSIMYYSKAIDSVYTACVQFIQWYNQQKH